MSEGEERRVTSMGKALRTLVDDAVTFFGPELSIALFALIAGPTLLFFFVFPFLVKPHRELEHSGSSAPAHPSSQKCPPATKAHSSPVGGDKRIPVCRNTRWR